jgi:hypothetical protein
MKNLFIFTLATLTLVGCKDTTGLSADENFSVNAKSALAVLPKDADVINKLDVSNLRSNAPTLFGQLSQNTPEAFDELMTATGFDPKKDVKEMYMTVQKTGNDSGVINAMLFADFDKDKLSQYVQSQVGTKFSSSTYRNNNVYCSTEGTADKQMCFAIGGNQAINMATSETAIKAMIDRSLGEGASVSSDTEMMQLLNQTTASDEGWMIIRNAEKMLSGAAASADASQGGMAINQIAQAIKSVVARTDVKDSETRSMIWMLPKQGVSATDLKSMFDAGLSFARMNLAQQASTQNQAELAAFSNILAKTSVTVSGNGILLDSTLPSTLLQKK